MVQADSTSNDALERKSVFTALKSYDNLQELGRHPLARLQTVEKRRRETGRADTLAGRGLSLRDVLRDAIEMLRPDPGSESYTDRYWRPFIILKEEYVDGRSPEYLAQKLRVALRTYQYARQQAIRKVTDILCQWEDEVLPVPVPVTNRAAFLAPPKHPYRLVGRYHLLQTLKAKLLAGDNLALNGSSGVGKTALALELAHDHDVLARFCDGVLWAGLGQEPVILNLIASWSRALGLPAEEVAKLATEEEGARVLREEIGLRRLLLIIDDAWCLEDALVFHVAGPNCACLLTTRFQEVAQVFAEDNSIKVEELSNAGGLLLLGQFAPGIVEAEPEAAQELVQVVGGLPSVITLMARYVRRKVGNREQPLRETLKQLQAKQARLEPDFPESSPS